MSQSSETAHPGQAAAEPGPGAGFALITGATAGIGLSFVHALADRGHDLVLVARDQARLDAVAEEVRGRGRRVETISADLADREQLSRVESRLADPGTPEDAVRLLVNNAGFGLKHRFLSNPIELEQAHLDVLVTAPMRLMHAALPAMIDAGGGGVINVSSVAGFLPRGSYSAAKAYLTKLSEWAHSEYAPHGVNVMALCPGFVKTEFHERMQVSRDSAPKPLWLDADFLVAEALGDFDAHKAVSIPSWRYKAIVAGAKLVPFSALQRLQGLGRK